MIYEKLKAIKIHLDRLSIFGANDIHFGDSVTELIKKIGRIHIPYCIIKSGEGDLDGRDLEATAYIFAVFQDKSDIEKIVLEKLRIIAREVTEIKNVEVTGYTTNADFFEPFGIPLVEIIPPMGGFRLDLRIHDIF